MATEEKWSFDKSDGLNWMTWKFQIRHLLLAKGVWRCVNRSEALPKYSSAQVHTDFEKKKQEQWAFSIITLAISTPQLYLVMSCEKLNDARDALWDHLLVLRSQKRTR